MKTQISIPTNNPTCGQCVLHPLCGQYQQVHEAQDTCILAVFKTNRTVKTQMMRSRLKKLPNLSDRLDLDPAQVLRNLL